MFSDRQGFLNPNSSEKKAIFRAVFVQYLGHGICSSGSGFSFLQAKILGEVLSSLIEGTPEQTWYDISFVARVT